MQNKGAVKSQTTVFIIISILIIVGIIFFVLINHDYFKKDVPSNIKPAYNHYLQCLEKEISEGSFLIGRKGGYIEDIDFSSGNKYMPFSSHLNFLGEGIPYWFYISGNGELIENVPKKNYLENQLKNFLEGNFYCDFSKFEKQGYKIDLREIEDSEVSIEDKKIKTQLRQYLEIQKGDISWIKREHSLDVDSRLGMLYDLATKIYEKNNNELFLEDYALDFLRLYAPVEGIEIGCNTKIWDLEKIRSDIMNAISINVPMIKIKGDYYDLSDKSNNYFIKNIEEDVNANVNFVYSKKWPFKMKATPNENGFLKANPVGDEQGFGMLGFCYVPYHFTYDLGYPVLIQISFGDDFFQFPVVVYVEKNSPRKNFAGFQLNENSVCKEKTVLINVYTYDSDLKPLETDIKYQCLEEVCDIGKTKIQESDAVLKAKFPRCSNGTLIASKKDYDSKIQSISSLEENSYNMVLNKNYELDLEIKSRGDSALIYFIKDGKSKIISYPDKKSVKLSEGNYKIETYVYTDSELVVRGDSFDKIISGGGIKEHYFSESDLEKNRLILEPSEFEISENLENIQLNYNRVKISDLKIEIK